MRNVLSIVVILLAVVILFTMSSLLPPGIGASDFRAYWSASYLLTHGENFADPQKMFEIERVRTAWLESYPMLTWNPPWLLAILAPLTVVSFERATSLWVLTNIILVFASEKVLWQITVSQANVKRFSWVPVLTVFAYSITLTSIAAGQVNILVFAGLAGFLFFDSYRHDASAGAALALALVKPQLVYALIPILLLNFAGSRRWRTLISFFAVLGGLTIGVFAMRPNFVAEYFATLGVGQLLNYQTPTLGGWIEMLLGWGWAKLIGVIVLPIALVLWWYTCRHWDTRTVVDVGLLLSVITAPFAWSYDFVVLLVPLTRIVGWVVDRQLPRADSVAIICVLVAANLFSFYERFSIKGEEYFFWIPLFVATLYIVVFWRVPRQLVYA